MNLKQLLFTLLLALMVTVSTMAQDQQLLAEQDISGTARFIGMAGAMTAVGGDPSAVVRNNPAGLGVYRRIESMISLDLQIDRTRHYGEAWDQQVYFIPSQVSANFAFGDDSRSRGVIFHNLMISYSRLKNWHRIYNGAAATTAEGSLNAVLENDVKGMNYNTFTDKNWADNTEVTWLSEMAYQQYMLDTLPGQTNLVSVILPNSPVGMASKIVESGYTNQFNINWAMNISNRYYFGLGLGIQTLYLRKDVYYSEAFYIDESGKSYNANYYTYLRYNGVGVNGTIGFIARPIRLLRVGVSFETPTLMTLKTQHEGDLSAFGLESFKTPTNTYRNSSWTQPMKTSVGIAFHLPKDKGLISVQYDAQFLKNLSTIHSLRLGAEFLPRENWYINAGYAFTSTFKDPHFVYPLEHGSIRTDTDNRNVRWNQYASIGFGYRGRSFIGHCAYQCSWDNSVIYPHELADGYDMRSFTHRVVFTFGFHSR